MQDRYFTQDFQNRVGKVVFYHLILCMNEDFFEDEEANDNEIRSVAKTVIALLAFVAGSIFIAVILLL